MAEGDNAKEWSLFTNDGLIKYKESKKSEDPSFLKRARTDILFYHKIE